MSKFKDKVLRPSGISKKKVESEFGLKMLQKMGWSEDKGLGAEGAGIKECIQVSRREELEGLGYNAKKFVDDNWWKDSFNQALQKVNQHIKVPAAVDDDDSEESLEVSEDTKPVLKRKMVKKQAAEVDGKRPRQRSRSASKQNSRKQSVAAGRPDSDYDSEDETLFGAVSRKGLKQRRKAQAAEATEE